MILPAKVLESFVGHDVVLLLKDGRFLDGKLDGIDEYMNILLEGGTETDEGKKKKFDTVIIRGNNIVSISLK